MPQLEYFLVAESAAVDQFTNRVSIFNVLESVRGQIPSQFQSIAISAWNREAGDEDIDFQVQVRILTPSGNTVGEFPINFRFTNPRQRVFQAVQVNLVEAGEFRFALSINGQHKASHALTVERLQ